ncbi:hypothetical protein [Sanguibacter sp. 25GB23B1]|uniref:hypothetical protein n=1 Tax=unclassified Sanguibacter TaxID=2645534 RepID=UPI0032AE8DA8
MLHPRRADARALYLRLGTGELAAAAVFTGTAWWAVAPHMSSPGDVAALWSALVPLLVVLLQAGAYWLLARRWVLASTMPRPLAQVYTVFRFTNRALLAVGLVGVLLWLPGDPAPMALVVGVWLFGMLEHVNYFVVRLSYPLRGWASQVARRRTPRLVKDVRAGLGPRGGTGTRAAANRI